MIKLAADENLNNNIIRGLLRRKLDIDIMRIQDVGLSGADDVAVLDWAAQEGRVLLTHDVCTRTKYACERIESGQSMPGLFEIDVNAPMGAIIEDILLLVELSLPGEWEGSIGYLPFK